MRGVAGADRGNGADRCRFRAASSYAGCSCALAHISQFWCRVLRRHAHCERGRAALRVTRHHRVPDVLPIDGIPGRLQAFALDRAARARGIPNLVQQCLTGFLGSFPAVSNDRRCRDLCLFTWSLRTVHRKCGDQAAGWLEVSMMASPAGILRYLRRKIGGLIFCSPRGRRHSAARSSARTSGVETRKAERRPGWAAGAPVRGRRGLVVAAADQEDEQLQVVAQLGGP
jgi:hypothetical protein